MNELLSWMEKYHVRKVEFTDYGRIVFWFHDDDQAKRDKDWEPQEFVKGAAIITDLYNLLDIKPRS